MNDTSTRALVSWEQQKELALWAAKSGQFKAIRSPQHALLLMEYGREMGFGPATSLQLIYMVSGIPALKANTIGSLIKQVKWQGTPKSRYDYRLVERTAERCMLEFFERGDDGVLESRGQITYTMEDAKLAGDTRNPNYKTRPKNMLFARCLTEGARVFCPDCLGGVVPYSTEELTETTETGEPVQIEEPPAKQREIVDVEWEEKVGDLPAVSEAEFQELREAIEGAGMNLANVIAAVGADPNDPRGLSAEQYAAAMRVVRNR